MPSAKSPAEALSATVSTMAMSQPVTRLSTISAETVIHSSAATTVSRSASSVRSRPMARATSPSTRGWRSRPAGMGSPSATSMSAKSIPKSGWSTPICRCTAGEVRPVLRPTSRRPASSQRRVFTSWTA